MSRLHRRAGIAYVLAMLYLLLFTVLAIGFYAATSLSIQIAKNDRSAADAQSAAESGLQFVRLHLGSLKIPNDTADAELLPTAAKLLGNRLNGSPDMNGHLVEVRENVIDLPDPGGFITMDPALGTRFQAQISTRGSSIRVKITGFGSNPEIRRAIQLDFRRTARDESADKLAAISGSYEEVAP